ncbi:ribonuclease III [Candidatus Uhrbacteria bacterium RIFCSPLOWO2_12_FULL_46_10]|uniref:Ribonuclease 3 n=1 Tax=Candidatus Uhrbacteria bacterium RIFCSPLOWO2_01_FULL_47_25 TaxID=1802402 RepID=A0A1F7UXW5_9BACT|nr:MAG: Ribonuclease 3 [Parcubacteria group bacterium GW2011_GWA2_46_9]OGL59737.1 MAG: ribonuclease III [Candidatus Uhrbacteria bacterium RIFCSPHIGHO2_01_FULL_46_23]OGL70533.1 MAG: ribonuclease III [Candidatus Uhrbacteria bacterium RIFCSPHIGHO2_02_FULL_47_29]OGL83066.1 MAG: ribonuclease III [Candidatus Uhrbacteria bacterium RIFCSPLOWO2_01_FULL_47_25]OGL84155.1 MAG: ribonuclease III [Candidatus Uhrbacteria bacterium RIFCSPLOWO2_02_FULL_46_19]OGL90743.1 MAG: ribonuclease III [Candidatus Uhrbacte
MADLKKLESILGVSFQDPSLLEQALVHRSYLNENPNFALGHNERLEFLGDAVIELIVTEYLYSTYPNPEGELTNWRASLVNAKMLSEIAASLSLNDYLYLSRGEAKEVNTKARQYILANAFEAVVGALYMDQGFAATSEFVTRTVISRLPYILEHELHLDPKSRFQEAAQEKVGITPSYRVLSEIGPDHAKVFTIGVYLDDEQVASGTGASKQEGEEAAAQAALVKKSW